MEQLLLYDNIRTDAPAGKAASLFGLLAQGHTGAVKDAGGRLRGDYYAVQRALLLAAGASADLTADVCADPPAGAASANLPAHTCWQDYICRLVAESDNLFSLQAERGEVSKPLAALACRETAFLRALYALDWEKAAAAMEDEASCVAVWDKAPSPWEGVHAALNMKDDAGAAAALAAYYETSGGGMFARYHTFHWDGGLIGVEHTDPVTIDALIGYRAQKERIIENVNFFTSGRPYNNMLLYGDRGTGKSSSVKALLHHFASRKLRLVALPKEKIGDLPALTEQLAPRGCKFIVFIDDLSFEENETGYKSFKSALEGGVRPQPANTLVCVTSNRRNIIKEIWRDREGQEDVNLNDALQEKRSLADRFGLAVTFSAPDKSEYLEIVKGIARRERLDMDEDELASLALQWEIRQSGRSGRAARQFIRHMASKTNEGIHN
ncbi:MAG: ATP-binding protein [Clostridiales Family XIII bacterium]|nr:ATP-binding protein [Clostridiales Family XIII bacterium]